ncbi:MAG: DUF1254 domain-containing protein [Rhizobiales bacterium]|nr:DUF1254 domain-containing protein [Hyphomicrobiales bacterium]
MRTYLALAAVGLLSALIASGTPMPSPAHAETVSPAEARTIAKEATIYGFPMVDSYRIQYSYFVDRSSPEFKASWNTIVNNARVYTPADKAIQTPNSDTPYSYVGADLRTEPIVLSVPAIEKKRYYSLQFIDMYTFNFAYVGSRATGNGAGNYLLAGPNWKGKTPAGINKVIRSETDFAFVLYRTQLFDPADIDNVRKIQAGYKVQPLSAFLGKAPPPAAPPVDFVKPLSPEAERTSPEFFPILNFLMGFTSPNPAETKIRARFARIGIGPDGTFDAKTLSPEMLDAIKGGMADAWETLDTYKKTEIDTGKATSSAGFGTRAHLNGDYLARMAGAAFGIYGNSAAEALYPAYFVDSEGQPLNGANRYQLRFAPGQLPPVKAFWSLTMYELPESLLYANALDRYLINSPMLPSLKRDPDGGITLYLQHDSPGADRESNWLPAPQGPFLAVMRLYWPEQAAVDGKWKSPPLTKIAEKKADVPASGDVVPVTVDNFIRAESDLYFASIVKDGAFGNFVHRREPAAIDNQTVIRLNRDTLYSSAVFDLAAGPVTITLPDAGKRFMSMQWINEDHYTPAVLYGGGAYTVDRDKAGSRYLVAAIRTFVDPNDPKDIAAVHALQDAIKVEQPGGLGRFEVPNFDPQSQKKVRDALLVLGATIPDFKQAFGTKLEVDPIRHLIGTATGWGGNPDKDAVYLNVTPEMNDGKTVYRLDVKDVPVDGFWSVSVYNAEGYYQPNTLNAYSLNDVTAKKGKDGAIVIQFGGCDGKVENCLPIEPGWNYTVRLYRPQASILDGTWTFPAPQPVE